MRLVLLHGFPEHWWSWREVLPLLAESTSRVLALDLRGFGTSDQREGLRTWLRVPMM